MYERTAGGGAGPSASARLNAGLHDIPPSGTSARKAYEKTMSEGSGKPQNTRDRLIGTYDYPAKPIVSGIVDSLSPNASKSTSGGSGGSGGSAPTSAKEELHYYEAPLAEMYGFSPETAYQEGLVNTSIRREMNDMRKAGLNPSVIYGSHNSSGSDSGIRPSQTSSASGGGGGGGFRRRSGKSNSGKYLFSGGAYYGTMAAVGTVVSIATKNVGAGMAAAGLAGTAMKALNGIFKKK